MLFPNPDGFVVALMTRASNYCFAGRNRFAQHHPDFIRELHMNRLALDPASRREAPQDSVRLVGGPIVVEGYLPVKGTGRETIEAEQGEVLLRVKLAIKGGGVSKDSRGAADVDGLIRFTMGNIRLVGFDTSKGLSRRAGVSRYPIGVLTKDDRGGTVVERLSLDEGKVLERSGEVEFLFMWPSPVKAAPPQFVEFKRSARVKVSVKALAGQAG